MDTNRSGTIRVHSCSFVVLQFLFGCDALSIGGFSQRVKTEAAFAVNQRTANAREWTRTEGVLFAFIRGFSISRILPSVSAGRHKRSPNAAIVANHECDQSR